MEVMGVNKRVLICGNMGYVGPVLLEHLRTEFGRNIYIVGYDTGLFSGNLTNENIFPERHIDVQVFGDIRKFPGELLKDIDVVVQLAAVSNDPMGKEFEIPTHQINHEAAFEVAKKAKEWGVKKYLFASSCSVYGAGGVLPKNEQDVLNPLSAYAKSKIEAEQQLKSIASNDFKVFCFRFATACGYSPRLRLDLVLNDFVASAVINGKIDILSDGSPLRPLIHVKDMSKVFEWGITEEKVEENFLVLNVGSNDWNFSVKELAEEVASNFENPIEIFINYQAPPDQRSYKVDFSKLNIIAPRYYPTMSISETIKEIKYAIEKNPKRFDDFRLSNFIRLNALKDLKINESVNLNLEIK